MDYEIRKAVLADREAIDELIAESARGLSRADYSETQIEAALATVFGVDTDLILDGTYFVAETNSMLIGCGGWSMRKTLFGGDRFGHRDSSRLDPEAEAAKIRAFFVHSKFARRGIARKLLAVCEAEAKSAGFHALELMATLPGVKFYQACGYQLDKMVDYEIQGIKIEFVPMKKVLV